ALALGELDSARAREVEAHAAGCASCKRELEWLRAERELMSRRAAQAAPVPADLWRRIEARIHVAPVRRTSHWASVGGAVVIAAAAAMLLVFSRKPVPIAHQPDAGVPARRDKDPKRALDDAEKEYQQAIAIMEADIHRMRPDVNLEMMHKKVLVDSANAGDDCEARLARLDGYATYMHSLLDLEEARR